MFNSPVTLLVFKLIRLSPVMLEFSILTKFSTLNIDKGLKL